MEPQEIEIKDIEAIQEFVVKNYKITHSGGGGGKHSNHPRPSAEYMELFKIDGRTAQKLAGQRLPFTIQTAVSMRKDLQMQRGNIPV